MSSSSPTTTSASSSRLVSIQPPQSSSSTTAAKPRAPAPETPLQPYTSPLSGFTFPAIWSFPPFFTLQPNPETLAHQLNLWSGLVLAWARHTRTYIVSVDGVDALGSKGGEVAGEVFWNRRIQRRLLPPSMRTLLAHMAKEGKAAPDPPKSTNTYLLYWRNPEEWGSVIYDWIISNGMAGTIMTFYEITEGDLAYTTEFYELHPTILRRALDTLVKKGRAQLLKGEGESGDGVRFLSI